MKIGKHADKNCDTQISENESGRSSPRILCQSVARASNNNCWRSLRSTFRKAGNASDFVRHPIRARIRRLNFAGPPSTNSPLGVNTK